MKHKFKKTIALGMSASLLFGVTAFGAHPAGYWSYLSAFNEAKNAGNQDQMLTTGNALLQFYQNVPLDADVASIRYNVNYANYPIYEAKGNYYAAKQALSEVAKYGQYLGFTDAVIMANARQKKIEPGTNVYALVNNATAPYYGAKNEPKSGTWYGRTYNEQNAASVANESIVSFYVELGQQTAAEYAYLIDPVDNGSRAIHIALNFPNEADTVASVNSGSLDTQIQQTLSYLATLKGPVLLRIGGEMNVWQNATTPEAFKSAYTRIANMARQIAPNVALVFSTNYTSSWGGNMESYFPGSNVVDWIGTSLYMNKYQFAYDPKPGADTNEMYFGIGNYADPVKNMAETAALAQKYQKPLIVTEGGSGHSVSGAGDLSAFASQRLSELYNTLNMVYPQVKAIIYFDNNLGGYDYHLANNATMQNAYTSALRSNPTLISTVGATASTFVPLTSATRQSGVLTLRAYCDVIGQTVTATYSVDNNWVATQAAMPYRCQLDTSGLSVGKHTLKVVFSAPNGFYQTKTYQLNKAADGTVSFAAI